MIPPSLTAAAATMTTWDVVVIGGGPSGALAARQLALSGVRTLLVDRSGFPRPKVCGGCVNPHALALLESVGLRGAIQRMDGVPLSGWQLQSRGRTVRVPLGGGIAVSRSRLDAALVEAAGRAGASFLPENLAVVLPAASARESKFRHVRLMERGSPAGTLRTRIVLAADGLGHPSLRQLREFRTRVAAQSRIGLGAILLAFPESYAPGSIFMAVGARGYVGLVRTEEGALNLAAAVDPSGLKQHGGPANAVAAILYESGFSSIPGLPTAAWRGTPALTQYTDPPAASRVFLIGDAAGYVEPFTGEGIAWALQSAAAVVPLVLDGIRQWDGRLADQWRTVHRRRIVRRQWVCRIATSGLRHPSFIHGLIRVISLSPAVGSLLVRSISGSEAC